MILEPTTEIFIGRGEERKGSFKLAEVRRKLANGTLLPTDLYWADGMENWQPLASLPAEPPPLPSRDEEEEDNPYRPPLSDAASVPVRHPGIGRLLYFVLFMLISSGLGFVIESAQMTLESFWDRMIIVSFFLPIIALRLRNIGFHPLTCLIAFVPLLNAIVLFPCLFCQAGYALSRKLDNAGRIALVVFFVLFAVAVLSALLIPAL